MQSRDLADVINVARGQREALSALYERHSGVMLAVGVKIFGNRREAEDVLHDVFVEVWQRAGDYDPRRGRVKTWLLMMMRSRALDRVRSVGRARGTPLRDSRPEMAGVVMPDAESVLAGGELQSWLSELPENQRLVLHLGYFEGLSSREIAERLALPQGTIKSRVAAAMAKLRSRARLEVSA